MIKVKILKKNSQIESVEIKGHAGFASKGSDIVCAAVSAIVLTAGHFVEKLCKNSTLEKEGFYSIDTKMLIQQKTCDAQAVLRAMENGIAELQAEYPKNIKLEVKSL